MVAKKIFATMKDLATLIKLIIIPVLTYLFAISQATVKDLSEEETIAVWIIIIFFIVLIFSHLLHLIFKINIFKEPEKKIRDYKTW